jgi:hypothetical protein
MYFNVFERIHYNSKYLRVFECLHNAIQCIYREIMVYLKVFEYISMYFKYVSMYLKVFEFISMYFKYVSMYLKISKCIYRHCNWNFSITLSI